MGRKKKEIDKLTLCSNAALAEGLSYGKYMAKYNYRPPCLVEVETVPVVKVEEEKLVRNCKRCGREFNTSYGRRCYCSYECQQMADLERKKQRYAEERSRENRKCAVCGGKILGDRPMSAKYCSKKCKMVADYVTRRERMREELCNNEGKEWLKNGQQGETSKSVLPGNPEYR